MKMLSRDFTRGEKVALLLLCLVLVGLCYYYFVDKPVRTQLEEARIESESLQTELTAVNTKIATLTRMKEELESMEANGTLSLMPSYNSSKEEVALLNDILDSTLEYTVTFSGATRSGDQIRRNFSLQFKVQNYAIMERLLRQLVHSEYRCLIGNVQCSAVQDRYRSNTVTTTGTLSDGTIVRTNRQATLENDNVQATVTATFYETMVGGTADAGLPASS